MREFFRGWRRKAGLAMVLVLPAVVAAILAVRSNDRTPPASTQEQPTAARHPATLESVAKRPVTDADRKAIYDALVRHVLEDPELRFSRDFYGTPGDNRFALVAGIYDLSWPDSYTPSVGGYEIVRVDRGANIDPHSPRLLGIRLDKIDLDYKRDPNKFRPFGDGQIEITLLCAGGTGEGGGPIGGCSVYYDAHRDGEKWSVECIGAIDP